eukprot:COSAG04_NODE_77_length_28411_cov_8.599181_17_plen_125_part_00
MLSIFGEWMTQQIAGGMAGNLGQIQLAGHVTCSNLFMFVSPATSVEPSTTRLSDADRCCQQMFPIPFGVSMAATVRVGNLLGAGNGPQGKTVTKMTFALTAVVQAVTCVAMYVLREQLPLIYTE